MRRAAGMAFFAGLFLSSACQAASPTRGSYFLKFDQTEMRVDHIAAHSPLTMKKRSCMISLSYSLPVGSALFSSQFELPLLASDRLLSGGWNHAALGDYIVRLSNSPAYSSTFQILASAKF